jgi:hypothetical protein
VFPEEEL